jgi:hypothetical protein
MRGIQGPGESRPSNQAHPHGSPVCPLSDEEIADWAPRLGSPVSSNLNERAAREKQLRTVATEGFNRATILYRVLTLPPNGPHSPVVRVDTALPEIAGRLEASRQELLDLPGAVTAALRVRFADYDHVLNALGALPLMLQEVAASWHKPHSGQPKLGIEAEAIGFLIKAVERFTGAKLPSPRSEKRQAEFEFVRLLTRRLLPEFTDEHFRTALRHWNKIRRAAKP